MALRLGKSAGTHPLPCPAFPTLLLPVQLAAFPSPGRAGLGAAPNTAASVPHQQSHCPPPRESPLGGLPETQSREGVAGPQLSSGAASSPVPGAVPWLQTPLDRSWWDGLSASHGDKGLPLAAMPCWGAEKSGINPNPAGREGCAFVPHRKSSVVSAARHPG